MSGHRHCWHVLAAPGMLGCCDCSASLMPGGDFEVCERSHSITPAGRAAMHTNALTNLQTVMGQCQEISEGAPSED